MNSGLVSSPRAQKGVFPAVTEKRTAVGEAASLQGPRCQHIRNTQNRKRQLMQKELLLFPFSELKTAARGGRKLAKG